MNLSTTASCAFHPLLYEFVEGLSPRIQKVPEKSTVGVLKERSEGFPESSVNIRPQTQRKD